MTQEKIKVIYPDTKIKSTAKPTIIKHGYSICYIYHSTAGKICVLSSISCIFLESHKKNDTAYHQIKASGHNFFEVHDSKKLNHFVHNNTQFVRERVGFDFSNYRHFLICDTDSVIDFFARDATLTIYDESLDAVIPTLYHHLVYDYD